MVIVDDRNNCQLKKKITGQNVSAYIIQLMVITSAKWNEEPRNASMAEAILLRYHFTV